MTVNTMDIKGSSCVLSHSDTESIYFEKNINEWGN